jgi:hypothetical protein
MRRLATMAEHLRAFDERRPRRPGDVRVRAFVRGTPPDRCGLTTWSEGRAPTERQIRRESRAPKNEMGSEGEPGLHGSSDVDPMTRLRSLADTTSLAE